MRLPAAQYSVPMADEPGRIADALEGINDRLAAVERMGREQFELDQRLTALDDAVAEVVRRMTAVQETTSAVRAEHATRLVDLQRVVEQSRLTPSSADGFAAVADAVTRLERRVDAIAELLETLVSDDPGRRTAERVTERIERLREVAGGVGDAIREELRRRRAGRPPSIDSD